MTLERMVRPSYKWEKIFHLSSLMLQFLTENIVHADFPHRSLNSSLDCKTPGATDLSKPHVESRTLVRHSERLDIAVLDSSRFSYIFCKVTKSLMCFGKEDNYDCYYTVRHFVSCIYRECKCRS